MPALRKMDLSHVTVLPPREEEAFSMLQHSFTDLCPTRGSNRRMWVVAAADVKSPPCCCALLTRRDFDRHFNLQVVHLHVLRARGRRLVGDDAAAGRLVARA